MIIAFQEEHQIGEVLVRDLITADGAQFSAMAQPMVILRQASFNEFYQDLLESGASLPEDLVQRYCKQHRYFYKVSTD